MKKRDIKRLLWCCLLLLAVLFTAGCKLFDLDNGQDVSGKHIYYIGQIDTPGFAYAVDLFGNYAYVADGVGGLRVIDVSLPHFPQEHSFYEGEGNYFDVKYSGDNYVFLAAGSEGFEVVDVSEMLDPYLAGSYGTFNAFGLDFAGRYVYLADSVDGVKILNVESPFSVYQVSSFSVSGLNANNTTLSWPYLYVSSRYGFSIVDVSNVNHPRQIHFENLNYVYDIAIADHLAYVAFEGGLMIYDVSKPDDPIELGFCHLPAIARSVTVRGEFAYLGLGRSGLSIVRVTNPRQPLEVAYHNPSVGEMNDIFLSGRYMYIANGDGGLLILEFWPGF